MKNLLYLLCFCLFTVSGQNSNEIVIGKIDSIHSKILNEERKIWVHSPENISNGIYAKKKYPVVYVLDGDGHFYSVVGMIRQLSSNGVCPEMIVVGIPNTNRNRDLTPTKGKPGLWVDSNMIENSGGGENFMSFIQKELMPYIDSNYPTQSYKMLIGHSLGGLTVMNTFMHHPDLFDSYVAIDPSMWWDDKRLLNEIKQRQFDKKYDGKKLYIGIANTLNEGMDITSVQKDTTNETQHIRSILELDTFLNKNDHNKLFYMGKYYKNDDHGSVVLITEYDALRFIFNSYKLKLENQYFSDPESDFLDKIVNHHKKLSEEFKTEIKPDEEYINSLAYHFLNTKQLKKSEEFFKLNVTNYPENFNAYDSLGDFYAVTGKKEKAIENYKKSISLNKDSFSKVKLKELKNKDSISLDRITELNAE